MKLTRTVAPATDVVTLAEIRSWLAFDAGVTEDDAVLERLVDEVTDYVENETNRRIRTQTWTVQLDGDEIQTEIPIPLVPLQSVSSIKTTDDDGDETTVTSTEYQVRAGHNPRVILTSSGSWPTDYRDHDSMVITCIVGETGTVVPFAAANGTPGLDDLTAALSDTWDGTARTTFEVEIDNADASPETFKWRAITTDADGQKTHGAWTAAVAITGAAQALANNLTVTLGATTGHTLADSWTVQMYERIDARIRMLLKGMIMHQYDGKGRGVREVMPGQFAGVPRQFERLINALRVEVF